MYPKELRNTCEAVINHEVSQLRTDTLHAFDCKDILALLDRIDRMAFQIRMRSQEIKKYTGFIDGALYDLKLTTGDTA